MIKKHLKRIFSGPQKTSSDIQTSQKTTRDNLERKVDEGVRKAIRDYRETFDILAKHDRS